MFAFHSIATEWQTLADVRKVTILLQKSSIRRALRLSLVVLGHWLPPAPLRAVALTRR